MKKLFALILAACMLLGLCACGGGGSGSGGNGTTKPTQPSNPNKDSVAGFYEMVGLEENGEYTDMKELDNINPDDLSYVIMKDDGTAIVFMDDQEYQVTYNGNSFLDEEGDGIDYDFKDGQLVLYFDEGITYYYEKTDREGPTTGIDKGGEAFTADAIESFEGDWFGWCAVNYGIGKFEEFEVDAFEAVARFVFDQNGNCDPFLAISALVSDDSFQNITVSYDSYGDYMYLNGKLFNTEIEEFNLCDLGGFLSGTLILSEGDDYLSVSVTFVKIGDTWDSEIHDPCMPEDVQAEYEDLDLIDIAELFGADLDLIPEA